MPEFTFFEEPKQATMNFSLFLNMSTVPNKSYPGKFSYVWHFQRIGVNAIKFDKTQIHV